MSRVKSVLLVDFDNIYAATGEGFTENVANWLLWLEDGALSYKQKRRKFLAKRVYWNLQHDVHRPAFEAAGFEAFNCRAFAKNKISSGKSSADIVLTMDAIEMALHLKDLEEIIVLTTDSDFVPVVNRIQSPRLRVVTAGKETDPTYELYSQHADGVVHMSALKAACEYERTKRKWYRFRSPPPDVAAPRLVQERRSPLMMKVRNAVRDEAESHDPRPQDQHPHLTRAAELVMELGARTPDQPIAREKIIKALSAIPDFSTTPLKGQPAWFGLRNFAVMMMRLRAIEPCIEVRPQKRNGTQVICRVPRKAAPAVVQATAEATA
ncbi:MAG: hypothetical protein VR74_00825 [Hyphomonas sp. BRH_c22]|nr:MAG: hypothetical protein VR74_00825 [Hyphomonas sp. BRH_c22]